MGRSLCSARRGGRHRGGQRSRPVEAEEIRLRGLVEHASDVTMIVKADGHVLRLAGGVDHRQPACQGHGPWHRARRPLLDGAVSVPVSSVEAAAPPYSTSEHDLSSSGAVLELELDMLQPIAGPRDRGGDREPADRHGAQRCLPTGSRPDHCLRGAHEHRGEAGIEGGEARWRDVGEAAGAIEGGGDRRSPRHHGVPPRRA